MKTAKVYQILRKIRLNKGYQQKVIANELNVSVQYIHKMERKWVEQSERHLLKWLDALDIVNEHEWFHEKHRREILEHKLVDTRVPNPEEVAKIIDTYPKMPLILELQIKQHILTHTQTMPRIAQVANEDIINERST